MLDACFFCITLVDMDKGNTILTNCYSYLKDYRSLKRIVKIESSSIYDKRKEEREMMKEE